MLIAQFRSGDPLSSDAFIEAINKTAAKEIDRENGNTPLHYACCCAAPLKVVKALLKANKSAASVKDSDGNIPLVGAVANGAGADVVQALINAFPGGVTARQGQHTLLHSACCNGASEATVAVLLKAWPAAARERDADGNTPLHFAAAGKANLGVVEALIKEYPEAATLKGQMGRLPLSLALLCEAPPDTCVAIRDANPGAMREMSLVSDYLNHGYGIIGAATPPTGPTPSTRRQVGK